MRFIQDCFLNERCFPDEPGNVIAMFFGNFCQPGTHWLFPGCEFGGPCNADGEDDGWCLSLFRGPTVALLTASDRRCRRARWYVRPLSGHNAETACSGGICLGDLYLCESLPRVRCLELFNLDDLLPSLDRQWGLHRTRVWYSSSRRTAANLRPAELRTRAPVRPELRDGRWRICIVTPADAQSGAIGSCEAGVCTGYTDNPPSVSAW